MSEILTQAVSEDVVLHNVESQPSEQQADLPELLSKLDNYQLYFYRNEAQEYAVRQKAAAIAQEAEIMEQGIQLKSHVYEDPYTNPVDREFVDTVFEAMMGMRLTWGDELVYPGNRTAGPDTPLTEAFKKLSPAMDHWRTYLVPTAAALSTLYNPDLAKLPDRITKDGAYVPGAEVDGVARAIFAESLDGRAIRSRGDAVRESFIDQFENTEQYPIGSEINIASLACGAAEVVFGAATELVQKRPDLKINIYLADHDEQALRQASVFAETDPYLQQLREKGKLDITFNNANILDPKKLEEIKSSTKDGKGFDFVDVVGFLEYLPEKHRDRVIAEPFMRQAYGIVKEGGVLCAANMRDTHAQLEFTTNCVRWPYIVPRSLPTLIALAERSCELPSKDNMTVILPEDGAYAVLNTRKPISS